MPWVAKSWWVCVLGAAPRAASRHGDTSSSLKAQQLNSVVVGLKVKSASAHRKQI